MNSGKGDRRRASSVSQDTYYKNWNKIFRKKKTDKQKKREKS